MPSKMRACSKETSRRGEQSGVVIRRGLGVEQHLVTTRPTGEPVQNCDACAPSRPRRFFRYDDARNSVQLETASAIRRRLKPLCARCARGTTDPRSIIGSVIVHRLPLNLPDVSGRSTRCCHRSASAVGFADARRTRASTVGCLWCAHVRVRMLFLRKRNACSRSLLTKPPSHWNNVWLFTEAQSSLLLLTLPLQVEQ